MDILNINFTAPSALVVDRVEPEAPIERQPIRIFFTFFNQFGSTVSGTVSSPSGGQVNIADLAHGDKISGSLASIAPKAGSNVPIRLEFFKRNSEGTEIFSPDLAGETTIDIGGNFLVRIDQVEVLLTRSPLHDTDFVGLQVAVNGQNKLDESHPILDPDHPDMPVPQPIHWNRIGDVGNGIHPVNLVVGRENRAFPVLPRDKVGINYQIQNAGFNLSSDGVKEFFNKVSSAAAGVLGIVFAGSDWTKADQLTQFINEKQFANCDGLVALDFIMMTGAEMNEATKETGLFTETREYPGTSIGPDQIRRLYIPADGCKLPGDDMSRYRVTYSIQRVSF